MPYHSGLTDHRLVMVRSSSDTFYCSDKKRGSAKYIKSCKIIRLNNTLFCLFFPSWCSVCSEHNPEGKPLLAPWSMGRHAGLSLTNLIIFFRNLSETKRHLTKNLSYPLSLEEFSHCMEIVFILTAYIFWNWCLLGGFAKQALCKKTFQGQTVCFTRIYIKKYG